MLRSHRADPSRFRSLRAAVLVAVGFAIIIVTANGATPSRRADAPRRVGIDTTFGEVVREARKAYHSKKFEKAAALYTAALKMRPDPVNAAMLYMERGAVHAEWKRHGAAVADYDRASRLRPREAWLHNDAAWLRATSPDPAVRNGKMAVRQATRACELTAWKDSDELDTLAAAYAEVGDFDAALRWQKEAIARAPLAQRTKMHRRLSLYQNRTPYRLP